MRKYHSYEIRLQYLGGFDKNFSDTDKWHRTIEVSDSISLETLHSIIQKILDWDEIHLYGFSIRNQEYVFLGTDYQIILNNVNKRYFSCDIQLKKNDLVINQDFFYEYDFGDKHIFSLRLININKMSNEQHKCLPRLLSYQGKNIRQYPDTTIDSFIEHENNFPDPQLYLKNEYVNYAKDNKWKIRFIQKDDYNTLKKWRKGNDKKKWEKSVAILENRNGSLYAISKKIERHIGSIKSWIAAFNAFGLKGIDGNRKNNKTSKQSEKVTLRIKQLLEIFHNKPTEFNINRSNWTLGTLSEAYKKKYSTKISPSLIKLYLKISGYSIKKAQNVLTSPDPNYREKVDNLLNILWTLKDKEELFFIDELGPLRVKKYGGRCYTKKGESLTIPQNQKEKGSITLSAALSAKKNQVTWIYEESKDSSAMINLIEVLFNQHYDKSKLFITWDAASWHSSNELTDWLDKFNNDNPEHQNGPSIELIPLPSCSQFLNVIEAVFSGMKRAVIHHSNYQSEIEMKTAISLHFHERNENFLLNPKRAGNKIWDINFFKDYNNIKSGNYREW